MHIPRPTLPHGASPGQTRGAALVVGLLLLLVITILGVSGIQTTSMQTRMAANNADRNLALPVAEATLRAITQQLNDDDIKIAHFGTTAHPELTFGVQASADNRTCIINTPWADTISAPAEWDATDSAIYDITARDTFEDLNLSANPRYMISLLTPVTDPADPCYADSSAALEGGADSLGNHKYPTQRFVITAAGYGAQPETRVRVQSNITIIQ